MARRVVSYSDLEDGSLAAVASTSTLVTLDNDVATSSISTSSIGGTEDGRNGIAASGKGKRKRKGGKARQAASNKSSRLSSNDGASTARRGGVHWDDPSYVPLPSGAAGSTWRQEGQYDEDAVANTTDTQKEVAGHSDGAERDEEFFDAQSESPASILSDSDSSDGQPEDDEEPASTNEYTNWKYDENGDPYTGTSVLDGYQEEDYDEELGEDGLEEEEGSYDGDSDEDGASQKLSFLIPDLDDFNRNWQAKHQNGSSIGSKASLGYQHQHRPPVEVGGGGRMLTQSEIWGPTAITDAWTAAVQQFSDMHGPKTSSSELGTSKTTDAEDVVKEKASPEHDSKNASALWHDAPGHDSHLAKQIRLDTQQILQLKSQEKQQERETAPSALSVIPTQPSTVLEPKDTQPVPQVQKPSSGGAGPGQTIVPSGKLPGNHAWKRAVKTVRNTPNRIGLATVEKSETGKGTVINEQLLHEYWYAGYYAGLAQSQSQSQQSGPQFPPSFDHE